MKKEREKEVLSGLEITIKKFVVLLDCSFLPEEVKEALISLLPQMNIVQIDRLSNILESQYLNKETEGIDREYKDKIGKLVDKFREKSEKNIDGLMNNLAQLSQVL